MCQMDFPKILQPDILDVVVGEAHVHAARKRIFRVVMLGRRAGHSMAGDGEDHHFAGSEVAVSRFLAGRSVSKGHASTHTPSAKNGLNDGF